jgi:transcriptional regulator with XRE-family HTH domain
MRKTKEVLRLRFELGLGQREIARACSISQGAVHNYLKKAAAAGIHWPLPEGWDEKRIEETLFGHPLPVERPSERALPNFPSLYEQLQRHPHLTLQLALGRVSASEPGGLSLQPVLRALRAVAQEAGRSSSPRASARREGFRRLGWSYDPGS